MNIDKDLLTQAMDCGIIDLNEIRNMVETMNRKKLEEQFDLAKKQRKVWKGEGKDTRWKFKKDDGTIVAKASEEKIKVAFMEYQNEKSLASERNKITFGALYIEWLDYKREQVGLNKGNISPSTFRRYERDYERYIKGTSFDKMIVTQITPIHIEKFLKEMVTKNDLTRSSLNNILGYLRGTMLYACKKELLTNNPCNFIDIKPIRGFCKEIIKEDKDRVLNNEEMTSLIATLHEKQLVDDCYIQNYAIELATMCGMRVGEISALKWECVKDDVLKIDYSEHRLDYKDKSCEYYIGEPKNGKHREFPMSKEMKELFARIKAIQEKYNITSEYVFANQNGRVNSHTISCAMSRRCKDANIPTRSIHAIRRTVSSHLRTILPIASVANMLGHLEETNDKCYNYDIISYESKLECVSNMFKSFSKVA